MGIEHEELVDEVRMRSIEAPSRSIQDATAIDGEVGVALRELLGHALLASRRKDEMQRGQPRRSYPPALLGWK